MRYQRVGGTGLEVSELIFGGGHMGERVDKATTSNLVNQALDMGINSFYTAAGYNIGISEEVLGTALMGKRDRCVLMTKVGYYDDDLAGPRMSGLLRTAPRPNSSGLSRKHLFASIERSLRRLKTDYIDIYQIHFWDEDTPIEETLTTLDSLVASGKVRYIGCSQTAGWQLCLALGVSRELGIPRFETIQVRYNLLDRGVEREVLPAAAATGVSVLAFGALAGGVLSGRLDFRSKPSDRGNYQKYTDMYWSEADFSAARALQDLAKELGTTAFILAQRWVLSNEAVASLLIGPASSVELQEYSDVSGERLSVSEIEMISTALA